MAAHQAPQSLGFSRQEHCSGLPFPSPMHEKWKVKGKSLSRVRLLATPWTAAYQAPLSMGFSRQEYWSGMPLPSPPRCLSYVYCHCVKFKGKKGLTTMGINYNAPVRLNPFSKVANNKLWFLQDSRSNLANTASEISSFLMKLKLYKMSKLKTKFCVLFKILWMLTWMTSNLWVLFWFFFFFWQTPRVAIGTYLHFPVHKEENISTKRPIWNSVNDRGPVLKTRDI